ncbi:hypothetical protein F5Y10DRAFT_253898 [Nemania abortiva]|nr:hypothetical protein F5Y10DRAFT_253898 [Nemania abortiva]
MQRAQGATTLTILSSTPSDITMASNGGQDMKQPKRPSSLNEETPEERQLQRDLEHLSLLHVRCRDIRTAIPRMLIGLPEVAQKHSDSVETMFSELVNHLKSTSSEIQDFTALYTNEESKRVLEKARKSREANPKGIKTRPYEDNPDWADVPRIKGNE